MKRCLIGHTGFVGGNLGDQSSFDEFYNSSNINDIKGKRYDLIVCAGAPAAKWMANRNPGEDLKNINLLIDSLRGVKAGRFVLISTVDVYENPVNVDEDTPVEVSGLHPYGRHRFYLEEFVRTAFTRHNVVRLPGLFGKGLKKNAIYDLMNNNCLEMIDCESVLQFYGLSMLYVDLDVVMENDIPLVNFSTEPISIREVAREAFGIDFDNKTERGPAFYDMRSRYCSLFGSQLEHYMLSREEVLKQIKRFVDSERRG